MIDKSFLYDLIQNPLKISNLDFKEIIKILREVRPIFESENILLELELDKDDQEIYVIGDLHGNLKSLRKIMNIINKTNPKYVIFLGDFVDRGPNQLECLIYLLCLKILEPYRYYLLKGNHETLAMNKEYGFYQEVIQKCTSFDIYNEFLYIYDALPICSIINHKILCLHGGIPMDVNAIKKIKGLKSNLKTEEINQLKFEIMWNDPKENVKGFTASFRGEGAYFFGKDVFDEFMEINNLSYLIRSHEFFIEGYKWFFNQKLLNIFSSANYRGKSNPNPASYAIIHYNKIIPKNL